MAHLVHPKYPGWIGLVEDSATLICLLRLLPTAITTSDVIGYDAGSLLYIADVTAEYVDINNEYFYCIIDKNSWRTTSVMHKPEGSPHPVPWHGEYAYGDHNTEMGASHFGSFFNWCYMYPVSVSTTTISGQVLNDQGNPIPGAIVSWLNDDGIWLNSVTADGSGNYSIKVGSSSKKILVAGDPNSNTSQVHLL